MTDHPKLFLLVFLLVLAAVVVVGYRTWNLAFKRNLLRLGVQNARYTWFRGPRVQGVWEGRRVEAYITTTGGKSDPRIFVTFGVGPAVPGGLAASPGGEPGQEDLKGKLRSLLLINFRLTQGWAWAERQILGPDWIKPQLAHPCWRALAPVVDRMERRQGRA